MPGVRASLRVPDARWAVARLSLVRRRRSAETAVGVRRRRRRRPAFHAGRDRVVRHVRRSARPRRLFDELILTLLPGGAGGAGGPGRSGGSGGAGAGPTRPTCPTRPTRPTCPTCPT